MAILNDLPGFSIDITVRGSPLQEYDDIKDGGRDERTVIKYVKATSGQSFAVSIKLLPTFKFKGDCIVFEIYADGELMSKPMFIKNRRDRSTVIKGRPAGHDQIEKFRFADFQTDEASGTMRLSSKDTPKPREKDLKGRSVSHNVKLKAPEKCDAWTWYRTDPVLGEYNPGGTFVFYYRSLAALKSLLVIPRTPSPPPPPALEDRDIDTLNKDELRELQKRTQALRSQNEALVGIKRERKDDVGNRARKAARPSRGYAPLEIDDEGVVRECPTVTLAAREVIVIEDDD